MGQTTNLNWWMSDVWTIKSMILNHNFFSFQVRQDARFLRKRRPSECFNRTTNLEIPWWFSQHIKNPWSAREDIFMSLCPKKWKQILWLQEPQSPQMAGNLWLECSHPWDFSNCGFLIVPKSSFEISKRASIPFLAPNQVYSKSLAAFCLVYCIWKENKSKTFPFSDTSVVTVLPLVIWKWRDSDSWKKPSGNSLWPFWGWSSDPFNS